MAARAGPVGSGEELFEMVEDMSLDIGLPCNHISHIIFKLSNSIFPPLVDGGGMEKSIISIPLNQP